MTATALVSAKDASAWLASGQAMLIDVREPSEFAAAHIPYAVSAPLGTLTDALALMNLPSDRKLIFQCQKGGRGNTACEAVGATARGGQPVFNLDGGIEGWAKAGYPIVGSGRETVMPINRQVQLAVGLLVVSGIAFGFMVHWAGFVFAGMIGAALANAGATGWCGMAMLLQRAPWNQATRTAGRG